MILETGILLKRWRRLLIVIGVALVAVLAYGCGPGQPTPTSTAVPPTPIPTLASVAAIHDRASSHYNGDCLSCHSDIPKRTSLSSNVKEAHVAMMPFVPGFVADKGATNENCSFCHQGAELRDHSAGNIRRNVNVAMCAGCHGPQGPGKKFYTQ